MSNPFALVVSGDVVITSPDQNMPLEAFDPSPQTKPKLNSMFFCRFANVLFRFVFFVELSVLIRDLISGSPIWVVLLFRGK
jgi:hypothetical protein